MTRAEVLEGIRSSVIRIIIEKGEAAVDLHEDTKILGGSLLIDSLDLATLVVELQTLTGKDPFADGFIEFRTSGGIGRPLLR